MLLLVLGLIIFIGIHIVPTETSVRSRLVARYGENAYKGLFSLAALVGLVLIVYGFGQARYAVSGNPQLWDPPRWMRHITMTLMLPVFVLLAAAYLPGRISAAVKHPMLLSIKLWAFAHLLVSARLANFILFGALLAWGVYDRISVKRRGLPIKTGPVRNDIIALVIGLLVYAFMLLRGHTLFIGVPLIP